MKISELINQLQSLKDTHGDLYTVCDHIYGNYGPVDELHITSADIVNPETGKYMVDTEIVCIKC